MFSALIFLIMVSGIEVLANVVEHKPTTDDFLEHFHVSPFGFDKSSVRLKISWENAFGNDSFKELFVNDYSSDGYCKYSNSYDVSNHTNLIIIPNSDVKDQFQNILPGCSYKIVLNMGETILWKNYTVPECVGNFCMCITESTDFIKLTNVEFVQGGIYRVTYTYSQDTRLENKSQEITDVFYIKQDTDDKFFVSQGRYLKGAFEVPMEYLKDGENYTLVVRYKNTDNSNPHCEYESRLDFIAHNPGANNYHLITLISITLLLLLAFMLCMCVIWLLSTKTLMKIKKFIFPHEDLVTIQNLEKVPFNLPHQEINIFYTPLELSDNCDEFPRENLILKEVIGEGNFGKVHYAKAYNLNGIHGFSMVAVKQLREGAPNEELADFQAEIEMLKMLKKVGFHRNVVKFLGCVTKSQPYMTIMELVPNGNLKDYLLKLRDVWIKNKKQRRFFPDDMEDPLKSKEDTPETDDIIRYAVNMQTPLLSELETPPEAVLDHTELENFAHQIASGMAYLEKIPVTHRDLAARNVLIAKDKVLKISDFGMSRRGAYVNRHLNKKIPLRWMAIEAIEDYWTDNKSDVWSFAVVLWEIGTLGAFPYGSIPDNLLTNALKSGARLPRPEICTDDLYALMQSCWKENPKDRPTFANIINLLHAKKHVYVDFNSISPAYVFPPTD